MRITKTLLSLFFILPTLAVTCDEYDCGINTSVIHINVLSTQHCGISPELISADVSLEQNWNTIWEYMELNTDTTTVINCGLSSLYKHIFALDGKDSVAASKYLDIPITLNPNKDTTTLIFEKITEGFDTLSLSYNRVHKSYDRCGLNIDMENVTLNKQTFGDMVQGLNGNEAWFIFFVD